MASQSQTIQEKRVEWTAIVLTCQYKDSVYAFQRELEIRRQKHLFPPGALLLTVEDPKSHVGSGGATLNALLVVAEHLSAKAGYTVVTSDVLQTAHILIVHMGRDFPFDGCGRAFTCLPLEGPDTSPTVEALVCNIDVLLHTVTHKVGVGAPPGVWVCSTDMILSVPALPEVCWDGFNGVKVVSVPGSVSYAQNHGVYSVDQEGFVCDIIYQGSEEQINKCVQSDGKVPLVSGIVFFSSETAEKLLSTHVIPPLDACTYMGLDSGAKPIELSLFFDILLCMARGVTEEEFVHGQSKYCSDRARKESASLKNARAVLWKEIRSIPLTIAYIPEGAYSYMTMSSEDHIQNLTQQTTISSSFVFHQLAYSHVTHPELLSIGCSVVNSLLEGEVTVESQSAIQHCHLQGPLEIGKGCLMIGLDMSTSQSLRGCHLSDIIIQAHYIRLRDMWLKVFTIFGIHDDLQKCRSEKAASYLNGKWSEFFERTGIRSSDIWGCGVQESDQCLLSAQLFPVFHASEPVGLEDVLWFLSSEVFIRQVRLQKWNSSWRMSLRQILGCLDQEALLESRREIFFSRAQHKTREILLERKDDSLLPLIRAAVNEGYEQQLLNTLDHVASQAEDPGVAARALACIADILGCMARGHGGLRSGPAANRAWTPALHILEGGDIAQGVEALREERSRWLSRPDLLVRAARHYEGAEQILIRQAVMSACCFVTITETHLPSMNLWVIAECPARIDVSGGWSDTPPITYEHGGAVVDVAILVDKCKPTGAKVRRIAEPKLKLVSASGVRDGEVVTEIVCETLEDLQDYCQPHSPGALLKAAFICTEIIIYPSETSLQDQLIQRYGGGFELQTWSKLPHGSGLGTSSILAGAVMAALYSATGKSYNTDSLIHAVLHLEQILTTGGGWQDQVGGLVPGVKIGRSKAQLPLQVDVEQLPLPEGFLKTLNEHLLLVYTGKTRLARNLLQDVLRNWYARLPAVVQNADSLVANAEECAKAFSKGDLLQIGACLNIYWQQKKCMAPGCEPQAVKKMMDALQPHVYGQSLAGAGGGGFLYLLMKEANQKEVVQSILANTEGLGDFSVHDVDVDLNGISVAFCSSQDSTGAESW